MTRFRAALLAVALAPALHGQNATQDAPPKRAHHAIVYDDANGRVLIAGGSNDLNDTWEWDGTRWRRVGR